MLLPVLAGVGIWLLLQSKSAPKPTIQGRLTVLPLGTRLTSGFGWRMHPIAKVRKFHNGLDIGAPTGTPILAAGDGVVEFAGWNKGYGNLTRIEHGAGLSTRYGHQSKLLVSKGQRVSAGQVIGLVGSTGYSTGPHLHFEVRQNKVPQNPYNYLKFARKK